MTAHAAKWPRFTAFCRDDGGNATIEFVVLMPFLLVMIFSMAEAGVLMTRTIMLDRGIDIAIRDVRLGLTPGITHDEFRQKICESAFLLTTCNEAVLLELTPVANATSFPSGEVNCVDRTEEIEPTVTFVPGARSEIMFVRACLIVDPIFPGSGLGAVLPVDSSGGYAIVVQTAFMNEPV